MPEDLTIVPATTEGVLDALMEDRAAIAAQFPVDEAGHYTDQDLPDLTPQETAAQLREAGVHVVVFGTGKDADLLYGRGMLRAAAREERAEHRRSVRARARRDREAARASRMPK